MSAISSEKAPSEAGAAWSVQDSAELYGITGWGNGYVRVAESGSLEICPTSDPSSAVDLHSMVSGLVKRGINTPVLLRFSDMLGHRMRHIRGAFESAMKEMEYRGGYTCVYPIKVNQQRALCEELRDFASAIGFGLEAGSKPELLAVLGLTTAPRLNGDSATMPIVCNGFKDDEYIETVILATKLGRNITPVVESVHELTLILKHAKQYGVRPRIGVRIKPSARGAGKWEDSGGMRSKFGLHVSQVLELLERLKKEGMEDCLKLVHFHVGSQICDIKQVKTAISELAHIYCELYRLGATGLDTIDIGGGLGVDYDGSQSSWSSSMNYTLEEYATDIVYRIKAVCDQAKLGDGEVGVPHPRILSESGRALVAHSSILVADVLSASEFSADPNLAWVRSTIAQEEERGEEIPQPLLDLLDAYERSQNGGDLYEVFHDLMTARDESVTLFGMGYLNLPLRAVCERLFWATGQAILAAAERDEDLAATVEGLPDLLSDIYFCNFSLFQSLPDSWAISQLFPIVPIHRLDQRPTRRAILADITCDSDGKIDRFCSPEGGDARHALALHELEVNPDPEESSGGVWHKPYYLAIFLVGAYQEVLGDLHNLFGDTHAVHISIDEDGHPSIDEYIEGDTVREVLSYVQYDPDALKKDIRKDIERATKAGQMTLDEGRELMRFYEQGLEGYTYLE
ncbi:MAG: biosynthetic arginine decarboxylase [Phycisphaerales bacterium JB050]